MFWLAVLGAKLAEGSGAGAGADGSVALTVVP